MALLLDTQIIIWIEESPAKISTVAKSHIFSGELAYFSAASVWEIAIKIKTGKLSLQQPLDVFVANLYNGHRLLLLDISLPHIYYTQQLPLHHRDPFDRLLIAQSLTENIPVVTSDMIFDTYGVNRIW